MSRLRSKNKSIKIRNNNAGKEYRKVVRDSIALFQILSNVMKFQSKERSGDVSCGSGPAVFGNVMQGKEYMDIIQFKSGDQN